MLGLNATLGCNHLVNQVQGYLEGSSNNKFIGWLCEETFFSIEVTVVKSVLVFAGEIVLPILKKLNSSLANNL